MGQSTNAILFYGYCWDDEIEDLEDEDTEWEDRYAIAKGLGPYPSEGSDKEKDAYFKAQRGVIEASGCTLGFHCGNGEDIPYVAVAASEIEARRGHPKSVDPLHLTIKPEWAAQLNDFCQTLGLEPPQKKPRWWLVSYWN